MTAPRCSMTGVPINDPGDGIYDDGEWISWEWINSQLDDEEDPEDLEDLCERTTPPSVMELTRFFLDLVNLAREYQDLTGRYLEIWGELGEMYAEIRHGLVRHPKRFAGSDGTIDGALIEVKTISPEKKSDRVLIKRSGNFEKLLIVKVSEDFWFSSKLFDRGSQPSHQSTLERRRKLAMTSAPQSQSNARRRAKGRRALCSREASNQTQVELRFDACEPNIPEVVLHAGKLTPVYASHPPGHF